MTTTRRSQGDAKAEITYSHRTGCSDLGQEYEIHVTTLLALRCASLPQVKDFSIASNVNHVGDFDDVVLCTKTSDGRNIAYLIQLKHQENPVKISNQLFTYIATKGQSKKRHKYREDFSLSKYYSSYDQLVKEIKTDVHSSDIIKYLKGCDQIFFIIFTNKLAYENTILELHADDELEFLSTSPHKSVFRFKPSKINIDHRFLQNLLLFSNQIHLEKAPKMIEREIQKLFSSSKLTNLDFETIGQNLTEFVRQTARNGQTLSKNELVDKLVGLALQPYELDFSEDRFSDFQASRGRSIWSQLTSGKAITLIESDELVFEFLKSFIEEQVVGCAKRNGDIFWNDLACVQMAAHGLDSKLGKLTDEMTLFEFYHCLWFNQKVPLLLTVQNNKDFQTILKILDYVKSKLQVVVLKPESAYIQTGKRIFALMDDLDFEHKMVILDHCVKFQGRPVILRTLLDDGFRSHIKCKDIVYILKNSFELGYQNPLPGNFILQSLVPACEASSPLELFSEPRGDSSGGGSTLNIITSKPGMGKTVFLSYLASRPPTDLWVVPISLTGHEDYFYDFSDCSAATHLDYFHKTLLETSHCTNKALSDALFQGFLKKKKCLILLDGFDEICPHFKSEVAALVKTFLDGMFEVWVTTRPIMMPYLKATFTCYNPTLWNLQPFLLADQERYLSKAYLELGGSQAQAEAFSRTFLETTKATFHDPTSSFTAIPLHLESLTKLLSTNLKQFGSLNPVNIFALLEEVLNEKSAILCRKFGGDSKRTQVFFKKYHELCALKLTFPPSLVKTLKIDGLLEKCLAGKDIEMIQRDGVWVPSSTTCEFTHRLFADFFAAQWLAGNFNSEDKITKNVAKRLLTYRFDDFNSSVFKIFDGMLAKSNPISARIIGGDLPTPGGHLQGLTNLDESGRTALHYLALHPKPTNRIVEVVAEIRQDLDVRDIILGYNPLDYALKSYNFALADELCKKTHFDVHVRISSHFKTCIFALCCRFGYMSLFRNLLVALGTQAILLEGYDPNYSIGAFCSLPGELQNDNFFTYLKDLKTETLSELFKLTASSNSFFSLRFVVSHGTSELLEALLDTLNDINETDQEGNTLLYYAAKFGRLEILKVLLLNGANPNQACQNGDAALHAASESGVLDVVSELLLNNASVNQENDAKQTALFLAVGNRHLEIVNHLIQSGADRELVDQEDNTLLHYAANGNFFEFVAKFLMTYPESASKQNLDGATGLELALRKEHSESAKLLLMGSDEQFVLHKVAKYGLTDILGELLLKGGNVDEKNHMGEAPLHLALVEGHVEACELLLEFGADCNLMNQDGCIPFHAAIQRDCDGLVQQMVSKGASLSKRGRFGATALHLAILHDRTNLALDLIGLEVEGNVADDFGNTALHYAAQLGNLEVINLLADSSDFNTQNCFGRTALHYAVISEKMEAANFLVRNGAQVASRDAYGKAPIDYARDLGNKGIIGLLEIGEDLEMGSFEGPVGEKQDMTFLLFGDTVKRRTHVETKTDLNLGSRKCSSGSPKENLLMTFLMESL